MTSNLPPWPGQGRLRESPWRGHAAAVASPKSGAASCDDLPVAAQRAADGSLRSVAGTTYRAPLVFARVAPGSILRKPSQPHSVA